MRMLRNFEYKPDLDLLVEVLERFEFKLYRNIAIIRFEVITPDSFMWRLLIGDAVFYLYAEDFVPGMDSVKQVFNLYVDNTDWSLIKSRKIVKFDDATPVLKAIAYDKPADADEMMRYAVDSGYDFVFLARSNERSDDAQFSDHAPRGFNLE